MGATTDISVHSWQTTVRRWDVAFPNTHTNQQRKRDSPSRCGPGVGVTSLRLPDMLDLRGVWGQGRLSLHVVLDCHHLLPSVSQAQTLIPWQYLDSDNDLCWHTKASWQRKQRES